jgi:hypothetical protein
MDLRQLLPLVIFGGGFSFIGAVLYGAWMLGRYSGREENSAPELEQVDARLYRLEQATVQMTSAMARLEAAHRMTARMIDEASRPATARLSPPRQGVTPH